MEPQSLFSKPEKHPPKKNLRSIACADEFDDQPMILGLKQGHNQLKFGNSAERFEWISQGSVDIGFISSTDFSRLKGGWKVFPNICKSSLGRSSTALFFNKNLSEINSIAVPTFSRTSSIVLQILLKELYQVDCKIVKSDLGLDSALKKYNAVLMTGNGALKEMAKNNSFIDLGEQWLDLTGLSLVYGFWIGNELIVNRDDYNQLTASLQLGNKSIAKIVENASLVTRLSLGTGGEQASGINSQSSLEEYLSKTISYTFGEAEKDALAELYKYAFFYGFIEYIPDFNFLEIKP